MDDMRLHYAACRGEGENACVIGPNEEVIVEITHGDAEAQWALAMMIGNMLSSRVNTEVGKLIFDRRVGIAVRHA